MRKFIIATALFATTTTLRCEPTPSALPEILPSEITLPTVTKKWRPPWDEKKPETTVEEIVQCIGNDVSAHRNAAKLQRAQEQLEAQHAALGKSIEAIKQSDQSLEASRKALQEKIDRFESGKKLLSERAASIEKSRKTAAASQASVKSFNAVVAAYYQDVAKQQALLTSLLEDQTAFNARVATRNQAIDQVRQESSLFNTSNEQFRDQVAQFTERSQAYTTNCTGEKTIRN
jgi:chromosome segregation ATPase